MKKALFIILGIILAGIFMYCTKNDFIENNNTPKPSFSQTPI